MYEIGSSLPSGAWQQTSGSLLSPFQIGWLSGSALSLKSCFDQPVDKRRRQTQRSERIRHTEDSDNSILSSLLLSQACLGKSPCFIGHRERVQYTDRRGVAGKPRVERPDGEVAGCRAVDGSAARSASLRAARPRLPLGARAAPVRPRHEVSAARDAVPAAAHAADHVVVAVGAEAHARAAEPVLAASPPASHSEPPALLPAPAPAWLLPAGPISRDGSAGCCRPLPAACPMSVERPRPGSAPGSSRRPRPRGGAPASYRQTASAWSSRGTAAALP